MEKVKIVKAFEDIMNVVIETDTSETQKWILLHKRSNDFVEV